MKTSTIENFFDWINERHRIWCKRQAGDTKPWTDDKIMQRYKFTNVFRQLDRGTIALQNMLNRSELTDEQIVWNVIWYRIFCLDIHANYFDQAPRDPDELMSYLNQRSENELKVFTGAYMLTGVSGERKLVTFGRIVRQAYELAPELVLLCRSRLMGVVWERLQVLPLIAGFLAYEMVCDLRFTRLLKNATDILSFSNIGPGCKRGLQRLGMLPTVEKMRSLLFMAPEYLDPYVKCHIDWSVIPRGTYPPFELREIEHSLCEFDKYERARLGEGRPKARYPGV